jgi:hypothetical protein
MVDFAKSMLEMGHALGAKVLLVCSSTSTHATTDPDALARDPRKLAMLAVLLGINATYEGLSWGRTINEFTSARDIVSRAANGVCQCGGFTPSLLAWTRAAVNAPSVPNCAPMKTYPPATRSERLPGTVRTIGTPSGTTIFYASPSCRF